MTDEQKTIFQREELYRTIIETAHDLIWILDCKGNFTYFNKRCEETSGYKISEWVGKCFVPLIYPEDLPRVKEVFLKTLAGNPQTYEVRVYDKKGSIFILSVISVPLYEMGKIVGTVSFGRDITEHKQMEESLKESEERYRRLVEFSPEGIFVHNLREIVFANTAGARILGAENPEELVGKPIREIIHPDCWKIVGERLRTEEEGEEASLLEEKFLRLDGTPVDVEVVAIPCTHQGRLEVHSVVRDITERKKAEEALRESETRYRDLVESARDIIFTISSDGKTVSLNTAFETITGWPRSQWIGKSFRPLIHPDDLPLARDTYQRAKRGENPTSSFELRILQESGDYVRMEFTITPQIYNGEMRSILGVARDITDRKKLEEIRLENERLLITSKAKSDFISTLSHELRTPLTSIIGFSELLKDRDVAGELSEKQERFVDKVLVNSNHLLELIDDILDLSRIEAGKLELAIEKFPVHEAIDKAIALIKEIAAKRNITIKKEIEPLDIEADKKRFIQVLLNLLSNAIKFSKPEKGTVTIILKRSGNMAQISVCDTGIGIKKEDIGRLFWAFEQLDSGITRKYGGTGLGLAITKKLVELHGGRIEVESDFDKGSTFTILLPLKANSVSTGL